MFLETLQFFTGMFVVVYDGQHALKFHLGRARDVVGPGVHFKWPIIQKFRVKDTKHTTLDLEPQLIQLADDLIYEVEAKVLYQIVDLKKAEIEIDNLETGLQNRVVMSIQRVVRSRDRDTIQDTDQMVELIHEELTSIETEWGVRILKFGFSNLSPTPASLEITQLDLLAKERLHLYEHLKEEGLSEDSAIVLLTGAVVATHPQSMAGHPRRMVKSKKNEDGEGTLDDALDEMVEDLDESFEDEFDDPMDDLPGSEDKKK